MTNAARTRLAGAQPVRLDSFTRMSRVAPERFTWTPGRSSARSASSIFTLAMACPFRPVITAPPRIPAVAAARPPDARSTRAPADFRQNSRPSGPRCPASPVGARDLTGRDQLVSNVYDDVARDRETDPRGRAASLRVLCRQRRGAGALAGDGWQWPAAVARVDRGTRLDRAGDVRARRAPPRMTAGAAGSHRPMTLADSWLAPAAAQARFNAPRDESIQTPRGQYSPAPLLFHHAASTTGQEERRQHGRERRRGGGQRGRGDNQRPRSSYRGQCGGDPRRRHDHRCRRGDYRRAPGCARRGGPELG